MNKKSPQVQKAKESEKQEFRSRVEISFSFYTSDPEFFLVRFARRAKQQFHRKICPRKEAVPRNLTGKVKLEG